MLGLRLLLVFIGCADLGNVVVLLLVLTMIWFGGALMSLWLVAGFLGCGGSVG